MKKLFLLIGVALLAFSCSSDEKEDENSSTSLQQIPINYTISVEDLEYKLGSFKITTITRHEGKGGLMCFFNGTKYSAFDGCCPIEWETGMPSGIYLLGKTYEGKSSLVCPICESIFDVETLKPVYGKAKDLGFSLVPYRIELDEEKQEYHITNPNYKGK